MTLVVTKFELHLIKSTFTAGDKAFCICSNKPPEFRPKDLAKSFPVPTGITPRTTSVSAKTLTAWFIKPSPPTAISVSIPESTDSFITPSTWLLSVGIKASVSTSNSFKRDCISSATESAFPLPDKGLKRSDTFIIL